MTCAKIIEQFPTELLVHLTILALGCQKESTVLSLSLAQQVLFQVLACARHCQLDVFWDANAKNSIGRISQGRFSSVHIYHLKSIVMVQADDPLRRVVRRGVRR